MEIAAAAGLELVAPDHRDVLHANSFGIDNSSSPPIARLRNSSSDSAGPPPAAAEPGRSPPSAHNSHDGHHLPPGGAALQQLHRTLSTRDFTTLGSVPVWDVAGSLNTPPSYPRLRRRLLSLSMFRLKTCFAVCSQEMLDVSALS